MTLSDRIERTMLLPVPRERVWDAVTKPEQFARWFGVVSAMDFRVGGAIQFTWENEPCPYPGVIEHKAQPGRIEFGEPDGRANPHLEAFQHVCKEAGLDAVLTPEIRYNVWMKFASLAPSSSPRISRG